MSDRICRMEEMNPDQFALAMAESPVAYVPMGTLEFHGYHLPIGNDALKAHAICLRAAAQTGGVVLPAQYWGTGGGHKAYPTSIIVEDAAVEVGLETTLRRLVEMGFRAIVILTGHYPGEQVSLVQEAADAIMAESDGSCQMWALPEYEAYRGVGATRSDHAAIWETSILMELRPELVSLEALNDHPDDPLCGVYGTDPRQASRALGKETVDGIVGELAAWVGRVLSW